MTTALLVLAALLVVTACSPSDEAPTEGGALGAEGAHEHGVARLDLAVDGNVLTAALVLPDEALQGFEHEPQTEQEYRARTDALARLRAALGEMIVLDEGLSCRVEAVHVLPDDGEEADHEPSATAAAPGEAPGHENVEDPDHDEEHSETRAEARFQCERDPTGSTLVLELTRHFPDIESVDVRSLSSARQFGGRIPAQGARVVL
jgi:hypothetical protein